MPNTIGTSVAYTCIVSFCRMMHSDNTAVKKGVVAPIAWLNDTGMCCRETLPATTEATKMTPSTPIFRRCARFFTLCLGAIPDARTMSESSAHIAMWHVVKNTGKRNPYTERRYLFRRITPMFEKYHAAIMPTLCAVFAAAMLPAGSKPAPAVEATWRSLATGESDPGDVSAPPCGCDRRGAMAADAKTAANDRSI